MLAIHGIQLKKNYGHYQVLQEVNLGIAPGECFALFGPNGSGKTTLLRILATLYRPTEGRFEILGRDGITLTEKWSNGARTFHGMHSRSFPNCFMMGHIQTGFTAELRRPF